MIQLSFSPTQHPFEKTAERQKKSSESGSKFLDHIPRCPSAISFVRSRMMYARAAINAKGEVKLGLRHIREYRKQEVAPYG